MGRLFGTDGVRGVANKELTAELAYKIGRAGAYVLAGKLQHKPVIIIGKDTRLSGDMLESSLIAGICSVGADVIRAGVIPTPGIAYLTRLYQCDAGVVISASHNSYEFNGIKFFNHRGYKLSDTIEEEIEAIIFGEAEEPKNVIDDKIGHCISRGHCEEDYAKYLTSLGTSLKNKRIAIECANGAAYKIAQRVFSDLGAEVLAIGNTPDGLNINAGCGSTHLENLQKYVVEIGANLGFAFDGDADRMLAIDENGEFIDGDKVLMICGIHLKNQDKLKNNAIVGTVMSNLGLNKYTRDNGLELIQTKVGDRYVLEEMLKDGFNLGGEQSGHVILLDYNPTGDGILTSLMLIKSILEESKKASELLDIVKLYPQILINAKVNSDKKYDYEKDEDIKIAIEKLEKEFAGNGRVLIRPSGTEPLVRVMIEGEEQEYITKKAKEIANLIEAKLK